MRFTTGILLAGSGALLWAAPAFAQGRPLPLPKPPAHTQTGTATEKAPPPANAEPRHGERYERGEYDRARSRQVVRLPAQVGADGRVYANFGNGLLLVSSQCSTPAAVTTSPTPAVVQPQVTQPVPQPIHQPVPGAGTQPASVTPTASSACWMRNANGVVEVYRYY
jgi:hypothetical protein